MAEINNTPSQAIGGMNLNTTLSSLQAGQITYALNAVVEGSDGQGIRYQNEEANKICFQLPEGFQMLFAYPITEQERIVIWSFNSSTGESEIGQAVNCVYTTLVKDPCLDFDPEFPIHKAHHRVIECGTEVYWTDGRKGRRFINLDKLPYKEIPDPNSCGLIQTAEWDCNKLSVQPNFSIPSVEMEEVTGEGTLVAGTYQFALQYASKDGEGYTSYHSVTNPLPIGDTTVITLDFNYPVNKAIRLRLSGIDTTGLYDYINLAVIKTVNGIASFELAGTYLIEKEERTVIYHGQRLQNLTEADIFEKLPVYASAQDSFTIGPILGWADLTLQDRHNFQEIASRISLQWQTWRLKAGSYSNPVHAANHRGYARDEVYPFELVFLLKNGYQTDSFHIPGRMINDTDRELLSNADVISDHSICEGPAEGQPRWKVYNTAINLGNAPEFQDTDCYEGPYQYGELAYWQSEETHSCDQDYWRTLAGTPIRHAKMPDETVCPRYNGGGEWIFPLGLRIDIQQIKDLIQNSSLSQDVKDSIQGFKIVRGNRAGGQKSVVARGLIQNMLTYSTSDRIIDSLNSTGTQTPIERLINNAIGLLRNAIKKVHIFGGPQAIPRFQSAILLLQAALSQVPGTPAFDALIREAKDKIEQGLVENIGDTAYSYASSASELCDAILEISASYAELGEAVIDRPEVRDDLYFTPNYLFNDVKGTDQFLSNVTVNEDSKSRFTFHSPDTHFYQPTLGNILKLEDIEEGLSKAHIREVKKHARYQFINSSAYLLSLVSGVAVGFASGMYGTTVKPFDGTAAFTAYKTVLDIIFKVVPRRNYCYQYNAVGNYTHPRPVPNNGHKQRSINLSRYLAPGMENAGDTYPINNYHRESSVYLRTSSSLPFTHEQGGLSDVSKLLVPTYEAITAPISSYYATVKRNLPSQWGQMYSYETIDTGFQWTGDITDNTPEVATIFGGDIFIGRFAYKSKMPFFLDHRVGFADDADISFNELSNVGKPKYWFSTDVKDARGAFGSIFGVKAHKLFWNQPTFFNDRGMIFLFAYGIPYFITESEVNLDLRSAFNDREGDFYPHASSEDWLQESHVSMAQDNTYHYNKTFSKQNKETYFSHLPETWDPSCDTRKPFDITYSDANNWRLYRPLSRFSLEQNKGALTSIHALENRSILCSFEKGSSVYNALLTINTSNPQAAYLGNGDVFSSAPPLEFNHIGSQHRLFIDTPYGGVNVDALRGKVWLWQGNSPKEITGEGIHKFLQANLKVDGDNAAQGKGITGVYDARHSRILLTKLDGAKSFTLSYNFKTQSWISFHSYLPRHYVAQPTHFLSGEGTSLWNHGTDITLFNSFYGQLHPYMLEHPYSYGVTDQIIASVKCYSQVLQYNADGSYIETNDVFFNKAILSSNQDCSGVLDLHPKPKNSLKAQMEFPKYNEASKGIICTKSDSLYHFNTLWDLVKNKTQPVWKPSTQNLSFYKELNTTNMDYSKRSRNKAPLRSKELKVMLQLTDRTDTRIISQVALTETQNSHK